MSQENNEKLKAMQESFNRVFTTEDGEKVLKALENICMANVSTFNTEPHTMAYQEGMRSVYLSIRRIMDMDIQMLEALTGR